MNELESKARSSKKNSDNLSRETGTAKYLDKEYYKNYRTWRKKNTFGYYLDNDENRLTYRDGFGLIKQYPEAEERAVLNKANGIVVFTLMIYTLITVLGSIAIPGFVSNTDIKVGTNYFRELISGSEWTVLAFLFLINVCSRLVPFVIILKILKMPLNIMLPLKTKNRKIIYSEALPAAVMNVFICFVLNQFYLHFLGKTGIDINITFELPENRAVLVLTLLLETVLVTITNEILVRGACMQLLRQFGDGYAIIITSLITAVESFDLRMSFCLFINSLIIGYFTIKTGSVMTAIVMRMAMRAFTILLLCMSAEPAPDYAYVHTAVLVLAGTLIPLIIMCVAREKNNDRMYLDIKDTFLSDYEKFMYFFTSPAVLIWLAVCFAISMCTVPMKI